MRPRRALLAAAILAAVLLATAFALGPALVERSFNRVDPARAGPVSDAARRLHASLPFVADLHDDMLLWGRDPLARAGRGHVDVPRLAAGNVALQVFSAVTKTPRGINYERNTGETDNVTALAVLQRWPPRTWRSRRARALYQAARLTDAAARSGGRLTIVRTAADLEAFVRRRAADRSLVAALLAIEGLHALDGDARSVDTRGVDTLYAAGFRMLGLTHFFDDEVAGSAHGVSGGGLTPLGRAVVRRMETLGVLVDLAHASPRAIDDVLAMAARPVVVSHTGVRATCPGPRNLTDDQIRRIAATGGVIGIGYWDGAVCEIGPASTARAVAHAARVAGVDHVALGSDFDGATRTPFDAAGLDQVTQALLDAGLTPDDIAKVMGGNVLRLLRETLPR